MALLGFFDDLMLSALVLTLPVVAAALLLWMSGIETRGIRLEEIQRALHA